MHGQNINLPVSVCVCVCVRHTFCQLAYRSDLLTPLTLTPLNLNSPALSPPTVTKANQKKLPIVADDEISAIPLPKFQESQQIRKSYVHCKMQNLGNF